MRALFLLPVLALGLTGCVTAKIQATTADGTVRAFSDPELAQHSRCDLRLCILENAGFMWNAVAKYYRQSYFSNVVLGVDVLSPQNCDVGLDFTNANGDHSDLISAYDRSKIASIDAHYHRAPKIICALFAPDQPLAAKLAGQRASAGVAASPAQVSAAPRTAFGFASGRETPLAPAPAPAQGLSAADIQRIAQAVKGAEAPAAAAALPLASPRYSAPERADDLAVIVGIENYSDIATKAPYAERDADAFKAHVRALGVPERNVVLLKGAKAGKAALEKNLEAWLPRLAKPTSRVYVYFSGHGAPDVKTGQAYLVPWDGDPNFLAETAYPVAKLYKSLGALPAKQVLVAMDSCFSGAGGRSVLASGARPLVSKVETGAVPAKLTVLSASAASEISGSLDERQHGAFTWFLLEGMNAGKTTPRALAEYLTPRVQDEAKRLNRDQTPQLQGDGAWSLR